MVLSLLAVVAPVVSSGAARAAGSAVIMPLGDSITDGQSAYPGAYRISLEQRLLDAGIVPDFVGSRANAPAADPEHEGHPGYRIDEISRSVTGWLTTYRPAIVQLLIGTNDIVQGYQLATAPLRLSGLIDQILATLPGVQVLVASVPPMSRADWDAAARAYNASVAALADQKALAGERVRFVDVYGAMARSDLSSDGVHPTAAGYARMAGAWYRALTGVL